MVRVVTNGKRGGEDAKHEKRLRGGLVLDIVLHGVHQEELELRVHLVHPGLGNRRCVNMGCSIDRPIVIRHNTDIAVTSPSRPPHGLKCHARGLA